MVIFLLHIDAFTVTSVTCMMRDTTVGGFTFSVQSLLRWCLKHYTYIGRNYKLLWRVPSHAIGRIAQQYYCHGTLSYNAYRAKFFDILDLIEIISAEDLQINRHWFVSLFFLLSITRHLILSIFSIILCYFAEHMINLGL